MGHYAFMCSSKAKGSRRPRRSNKEIVCFGCKNKGHMIMLCQNVSAGQKNSVEGSQPTLIRHSDQPSTVSAQIKNLDKKEKSPLNLGQGKAYKKAQLKHEKVVATKIKRRLCYTCHLKGHLSKDCPNGNKSEPNFVNTVFTINGKEKWTLVLER